jgi:hypothetical protein
MSRDDRGVSCDACGVRLLADEQDEAARTGSEMCFDHQRAPWSSERWRQFFGMLLDRGIPVRSNERVAMRAIIDGRGLVVSAGDPPLPPPVNFGLSVVQEPKYTVSGRGRLVNRSSGVEIPDDEPVFILRASDRKAASRLTSYQFECSNEAHRKAVSARVDAFLMFAIQHPKRMKEPDTATPGGDSR